MDQLGRALMRTDQRADGAIRGSPKSVPKCASLMDK